MVFQIYILQCNDRIFSEIFWYSFFDHHYQSLIQNLMAAFRILKKATFGDLLPRNNFNNSTFEKKALVKYYKGHCLTTGC